MSIKPKRDKQTVTAQGEDLTKLPHGVSFKEVRTHVDDRGSLCEMFDPRWKWHKDPFFYTYIFTIRPGIIKGWGMHKAHEDRYFLLSGEMEVILYDDRKNSPTKGLVSKIYLTEKNRRLMNIPIGVWHADRNIGTTDVVVANFPTIFYDHKSPDKFRLPLNTKKIPYKFDDPRGW